MRFRLQARGHGGTEARGGGEGGTGGGGGRGGEWQGGVEDEEGGGPLRLGMGGRPNVGKSTLVNALIGDGRLLTGPGAGVTRDAITVEWEYKGQRIALVDTAGLWRKARINEKLEGP